MVGANSCCNHVIAALCKVEYANAHAQCLAALTSMLCVWIKSTKTVIEPERISNIIIKKRLSSQMGEMLHDRESREYKRLVELDDFDPRLKLQRTMIGECLLIRFYT